MNIPMDQTPEHEPNTGGLGDLARQDIESLLQAERDDSNYRYGVPVLGSPEEFQAIAATKIGVLGPPKSKAAPSPSIHTGERPAEGLSTRFRMNPTGKPSGDHIVTGYAGLAEYFLGSEDPSSDVPLPSNVHRAELGAALKRVIETATSDPEPDKPTLSWQDLIEQAKDTPIDPSQLNTTYVLPEPVPGDRSLIDPKVIAFLRGEKGKSSCLVPEASPIVEPRYPDGSIILIPESPDYYAGLPWGVSTEEYVASLVAEHPELRIHLISQPSNIDDSFRVREGEDAIGFLTRIGALRDDTK